MTDQVVDYSWGRVGGGDLSHAQAVASSGFVGAMRYLCYPQDGIKRLSPFEVAALHTNGLAIGLVWETTADRAGAGTAAGQQDATEANRQADQLGWPADRPIYYAVDFQASAGAVRPYFAGAQSVGGRPVGIYGHYDLIETFSYLPFRWQCAAWSGNGSGSGGSIQGRRVSQYAQLYQRLGYVLGDTCDANDVLAPDWGGWHPDHPQQEEEVISEEDKEDIANRVALKVGVGSFKQFAAEIETIAAALNQTVTWDQGTPTLHPKD